MTERIFRKAAQIGKFMCHLSERFHKEDPERYRRAHRQGLPFGELAYAQAWCDWDRNGRPHAAFFSWATSQEECAFTIEFRKEISEEFGLRILTKEEAKKETLLYNQIAKIPVTGWEASDSKSPNKDWNVN